jgi:hypothetical protein
MDNQALYDFIIRAKAASYVGEGQPSPSSRPGSHDLKFTDGELTYLDSYFGGRDFIGEELVFYQGKPIWAMNYYGHILRADLLTPAQAGKIIKASLSKMYSEGRFLGGFEYRFEGFIYNDTSEGSIINFRGHEFITIRGESAYELFYHGGLILDD